MVVEDGNDILDLFSACLQSLRYKVISFDNPIKAFNYLNNNKNNKKDGNNDEENILANCSLIITDYKCHKCQELNL